MGGGGGWGLGIEYRIRVVVHATLAGGIDSLERTPEAVFVNIYGAQESIPRNRFRQPM
jgi:hypothetical protein